MPASAVEAEATGQEFVTAAYGGREWLIPLDVDTWPVDLIGAAVTVADTARVAVNYGAITELLRQILGQQWPAFQEVARKRRDLIPASQAFAQAVGIPCSGRVDVAFGAIPRLLRDLDQHPRAVEATLANAGHDYRHRFLFLGDRRRLTLRQIHVCLEGAPWDSPLAVALNGGRRPFSDETLTLMDLYEAIAHRPYFRRPLSDDARQERESAVQKEQRAVADYKRRHNGGTVPTAERRRTAAETARANAQAARQRKATAHGS